MVDPSGYVISRTSVFWRGSVVIAGGCRTAPMQTAPRWGCQEVSRIRRGRRPLHQGFNIYPQI